MKNILFAASEGVPFIKTGGLADVVGSLPKDIDPEYYDVRVMIPANADTFFMGPANKSFFKDCLLSGVKIYLRRGEFMHAKTFVTDDYLSCIGTANVDNRSFTLNYEDNAYIYDRELALENKAIFEKDLLLCDEFTLEDVNAWKWYHRLPQWLMRLAAPLL